MACMQKMQRSDVSEHFSAAKTGSLKLSSSRAQRGNLLPYNQPERDCHVATASRNDGSFGV